MIIIINIFFFFLFILSLLSTGIRCTPFFAFLQESGLVVLPPQILFLALSSCPHLCGRLLAACTMAASP